MQKHYAMKTTIFYFLEQQAKSISRQPTKWTIKTIKKTSLDQGRTDRMSLTHDLDQ